MYESNVDPITRFCHITKIQTTGWIELPEGSYKIDESIASTQIAVVAKWDSPKPMSKNTIAPLLMMSYDIETYSSTGEFPNEKLPEDYIVQVGVTLVKVGTPNRFRIVIVNGECSDPNVSEETMIIECNGE